MFKKVADSCSPPDEHLDEFGTAGFQERHGSLTGSRFGQECFTSILGSHQQDPLGMRPPTNCEILRGPLTREIIDQEVIWNITEQYVRVLDLLKEHSAALENLAQLISDWVSSVLRISQRSRC